MPACAVVERDVGATVAEYVRGLQSAFPEALTGGPLRFRASGHGAELEIDLAPQAARIIGGLTLPRLAVRIRFTAGSTAARAALLAHMDRAMQRGGG